MGEKKGNGYGRGTFVDTSLFLSPAYLSLGNKGTSPAVSTSSIKILMMLLGKRKFEKDNRNKGSFSKVCTNGKSLTLTYKELESKGIKQGSATRGFDELLAKGFISIVDPGGAFEKHKAVYALEDTYLLWRHNPEKPIVFNCRQKDIYRGYQNPKERAHKQFQRASTRVTHTLVNEGYPPSKTHALTGDTPISIKIKVLA